MLPSNGLQGCRKAREQGVLFGASALRPLPHIEQEYAATASTSLRTHQFRSAQSISLDSFQLPDRSTVHSQQPPFASLSSARPQKRKRKSASIASDVAATPTVHTRSKPDLVMLLAQNSAGPLESAADEQDLRENARAKVAAAGQNLKQSALQLPRQLRRLLAGAFAGALSKTTIAPIETIRMQVMGNKGTIMESIARTWGRKGVLGFFSGNSADILRVMPSKAIELAAFDAYKKMLSHEGDNGKLMRPGPLLTGLAGAAAGATSTVGLYPLETLRTRLAMGDYDNMLHAVRLITAEEGFMAFYQGIQASLIGILPYAAIRLGVYDGLKWSHRKYSKQEQIPPLPTMVYGAIAGLISASATFPVEVVRRRMMVGTAKGGTWAALTSIAQQEGWRSLYKGIGLTWAKQAPQYAVTFLAYDKLKEMLEV
ncbi:hypothetical protein WJX77_012276 [Trebouxia sp. C0004]